MREPHERALALLGVPFRPQGRDPEIGLDCVGVVLWVFQIKEADAPRYRLSDGDWEQVLRAVGRWFEPVIGGKACSGDLVVFRLSRSFHFGVISGSNLIHADLAVGKVTARRLPARLGRECRLFRYRGDS